MDITTRQNFTDRAVQFGRYATLAIQAASTKTLHGQALKPAQVRQLTEAAYVNARIAFHAADKALGCAS